MKSRLGALGLMLASLSNPIEARASDFCADQFNQFADELDRLAVQYDKIKSNPELCRFGRSTGVPLYESITKRAESIAGRCTNGAAAVEFARKNTREETARIAEICTKAGM